MCFTAGLDHTPSNPVGAVIQQHSRDAGPELCKPRALGGASIDVARLRVKVVFGGDASAHPVTAFHQGYLCVSAERAPCCACQSLWALC